ncbi:MAG: FAD-dependent oxidoreductase [Candidatus Tectomicrobia bacterium]
MRDPMYDYIVIGKGLMGAAAARHLSAMTSNVALVGPDEPVDRYTHSGMFGSHYDEGRITRILDPDPIWARLAQRSIERYRDIEAQSGVSFYHEVGHLMVGPEPQTDTDFIAQVQSVAHDLNVVCETFHANALVEQFLNLAFEPGSVGMYQPHTAGHVSPRSQVLAQATIAQKQGATLIPHIVRSVQPSAHAVAVTTTTGQVIWGHKALIATGGFSNTQELLPRPLDISVYARTIVFMELAAADVERLRTMPSIIYKPRHEDGHCYILPPMQYPDGKYYVKIGGHPHDPTLNSLEELQAWFKGRGYAETGEHLAAKLRSVVRNLNPVSIQTEACVTTSTPSAQIYADRIDGGRVGILAGGNGSSAKSADEIGRLGALMISHDEWVYDLDADNFRVQFSPAA